MCDVIIAVILGRLFPVPLPGFYMLLSRWSDHIHHLGRACSDMPGFLSRNCFSGVVLRSIGVCTEYTDGVLRMLQVTVKVHRGLVLLW